jgi:hypothetical protein
MSPAVSVAANLSPAARQEIGIEAIARTLPITHLADRHQVSRKFTSKAIRDSKRWMSRSHHHKEMTMYCFICQ